MIGRHQFSKDPGHCLLPSAWNGAMTHSAFLQRCNIVNEYTSKRPGMLDQKTHTEEENAY